MRTLHLTLCPFTVFNGRLAGPSTGPVQVPDRLDPLDRRTPTSDGYFTSDSNNMSQRREGRCPPRGRQTAGGQTARDRRRGDKKRGDRQLGQTARGQTAGGQTASLPFCRTAMLLIVRSRALSFLPLDETATNWWRRRISQY